jgi:hypothetical protein
MNRQVKITLPGCLKLTGTVKNEPFCCDYEQPLHSL